VVLLEVFDPIRIEVHLVVHLFVLLPFCVGSTTIRTQLWRATVGGGSAKTPIWGTHIVSEREWAY
jgi:hypothetical protein